MARIVCVIYARICVVFGPFVPGLPRLLQNVKPNNLQQKIERFRVNRDTTFCLLQGREEFKRGTSKSGPIPQPSRKIGGETRCSKSGPLPKSEKTDIDNRCIWKCKRAHQLATESTVGAAGLAVRYANIITLAECYLHAPTNINEEARGHMYEMLPENLKATVKAKLWGHCCRRIEEEQKEESNGGGCRSLAQGWRDALEEMMTWLGPVAHDTLKWQQERNLEKQRFDVKPTVSLFQTLYFSDLEKTEAAIAEVLVGLSCVYRYENKRPARPRPGAPFR